MDETPPVGWPPSFSSSFQLTPVSTLSSRPELASSTAKLATLRASPQPHGLGSHDGPAGFFRHEELVLVAVGESRLSRHAPVADRALHLLVETVRQAL